MPFDIGLARPAAPPDRAACTAAARGACSSTSASRPTTGPYIVANGKKSIAASDDTKANRDPDTAGSNGRRRDPGGGDDTAPGLDTTPDLPRGQRRQLHGRHRRARHVAAERHDRRGLPDHQGRGDEALLRRLRHGTAGTVEWHISATDNDRATITADQYESVRATRPTPPMRPGRRRSSRADAHRHGLDGRTCRARPASPARTTGTTTRRPGEPTHLRRLLGRPLPGRRARVPRRHDPRQGRRARPAATTVGRTREEPTALCLDASLDFKKSGSDRSPLSDLLAGDFELAPKLGGDANVDVRFRTGLNVGQSAGFPSVLGKFHLFWGFVRQPEPRGSTSATLDIAFDGAQPRRRQVHQPSSSARSSSRSRRSPGR